jgi:hypothetical protein
MSDDAEWAAREESADQICRMRAAVRDYMECTWVELQELSVSDLRDLYEQSRSELPPWR